MWLLSTVSLQLQSFFETGVPPYAILSHRWGDEEILYQDMVPAADQSKTQRKVGYFKLLGSCNLARKQGYEWIWIDTCCIDKSSSAELSEAINSMYQWYQAAQVCYAYLDDVESQDTLTESKWFTRGWTLQELIAPDTVEFYSARWVFLGTKRDLVRSVAAKSGVDVQVLMGGDPLEMSVARRMYWASHRVTTRVEDEAYCLLGLFGVNMPLIYGEGRKAFRRLQEEIIRSSDDQSILAWYATEEADGTGVDFLASRSSDFLESGDIAAYPYRRTGKEAMVITSQGLSLELVILSFKRDDAATTEDGELFGEVDAILDCQIGSIPGTFPSIRLKRHAYGGGPGRRQHYYRIISSGFQSHFSAQRDQFESCDLEALRDDKKLVIGLDPTRLDQDVYKKRLDRSSDYAPWQQQQIIISRPLGSVTRKTLSSHASGDQGNCAPWSLLLASSSVEANQRGFWFIFFGEAHPDWVDWPEIRIDDVYPPERFDIPSKQLRTTPIPQKYYNLHRFKCVDGIMRLSFIYRVPPNHVRLGARLLIGRQASSRHQNPEPWCQFIDVLDPESEMLDDSFITQYERLWPAPDGPKTTSLVFHDRKSRTVRASVREKEISGVVYYLVVVELVTMYGSADTIKVLQREDPHDRKPQAAENKGASEPLRL